MISAILQGGADKVAEAGAVVAGGHTVIDQEPKYGLCVTGLVHPDRITAKARAQPGDVLLLTKPLGTGVITTAHKRGVVAEQHLQAAIDSMVKLNRRAAELAETVGLHSATDITGYGLLGHAEELARNSGVALRDRAGAGAAAPRRARIRPPGHLPRWAGPQPRLSAWRGFCAPGAGSGRGAAQLLFDPQTSGGLLFALPRAGSSCTARALRRGGRADLGDWPGGGGGGDRRDRRERHDK